MQERVGLQAVTDGEFRRRSWWLDLIMGWDGFSADRTGSDTLKWRNDQGVTQASPTVGHGPDPLAAQSVVRAFKFLKRNTRAVPKVTMPAPNCVHFYMGGRSPHRSTRTGMRSGRMSSRPTGPRSRRWSTPARATSSSTTPASRFCATRRIASTVRRWGEDPDALLRVYARTNERSARRCPRACHGHVPPVPRQPRRHTGWRRAATTRWPTCCSTRSTFTATSSSTIPRGPARSRRCGCCRRARAWCWASVSVEDARAGIRDDLKRRIEASRDIRAARPARGQPAVRLLQLDRGQSAGPEPSRKPSSGASSKWRTRYGEQHEKTQARAEARHLSAHLPAGVLRADEEDRRAQPVARRARSSAGCTSRCCGTSSGASR